MRSAPAYFAIYCLLAASPNSLHSQVTPPTLTVHLQESNQVAVGWKDDGFDYLVEEADALAEGAVWFPVEEGPFINGGQSMVVFPVTEKSRYFRLRLQDLTRVVDSSPADGETGVGVLRETVLFFGRPLAADAVVTTDRFFAGIGGRKLLSRVELSSDRTKATLFYLEPLPGSTRISVVFDGNGLKDNTGRLIDADGDGIEGGSAVVGFETLSLTPLTGTAVIGRVFASELMPGPDTGTNAVNKPLAGVTITVDGMEQSIRAVTDAQGNFTLTNSPAGRFFVHIDGRTVSDPAAGIHYPDQAYYPFVGKAWDAVAGRTDNKAGGTGEIYLPLIPAGTLRTVSADTDTTITFPPDVLQKNPALDGVSITVRANSLFSDNGSRGGKVGIAAVPPDRLPGPLPEGLEMAIVITVQTDGGLNFDKPAPICFPNLPDPVLKTPLLPGSKQSLFSFNHDIGVWESVGSMTVSADGKFICTDPGVGIRQPGWHGTGPNPCKPPPKPQPICRNRRGPCPCKEDGEQLNNCTQSCAIQTDTCVEKVTAELLEARKWCDARCVILEEQPCDSAENKKILDRCFDDAFKTAIRARAHCYQFQVECTDWCFGCWGDSDASRSGAHPAGPDPIHDQILALVGQMESLAKPFIEGNLPIPESIVTQVNQLTQQADELAGGDAGAYLRATAKTLAASTGRELSELELGNAPEYPIAYVATIYRPGSALLLRGLTGPWGQYEIFLPRDGALVNVQFYDPKTREYARVMPDPNLNLEFRLPRFVLAPLADNEPDTDNDGLPDVAEEVIGTSATKADTDGDGVKDGGELDQGSNPLDGLPVTTGTIARTMTPGPAVDVWAGNDLVVTAEESAGVSIFNAYRGLGPAIINQVTGLGSALRVASDGSFVVVATAVDGLKVIDIRDPGNAAVIHSIPWTNPRGVVADAGVGYVSHDGRVVSAVDLELGEVAGQVTLPGTVSDIALAGDYLYAATETSVVAIQVANNSLVIKGSATNRPTPNGVVNLRLFAGTGVALTTHRKGYDAFSLVTPDLPVVVSKGNSGQAGWEKIVADGSGWGVAAVGPGSNLASPHDVSLYDLKTLQQNEVFLTQLISPGVARSVAIFNGLAYVADGPGGLSVMNYRPADLLSVAPTVTLVSSIPSSGVVERNLTTITAIAEDDMQVRNVEFYLDGQLVSDDGGFPFEHRFRAPAINATKTNIIIRARVFDTGGNFAWSDLVTLPLVPDTTIPQVLSATPLVGGKVITQVTARFSEPISLASLTTTSVRVMNPGGDGQFGTPDDQTMPGGTISYVAVPPTVTLSFGAPLAIGSYQLVLDAKVKDLSGNGLAAFSHGFRVANAVFWASENDGLWSDPANWSEGVVPGATDDVIIDVPSRNAQITVGSGSVVVRSLDTQERVLLAQTDFRVSEEIQLHNTMTLDGATVRNAKVIQSESNQLRFTAQRIHGLDNVHLVGDLVWDRNNGATVQIRNGFVLEGTVYLDFDLLEFIDNQTWNVGSVVFGTGGAIQFDAQLTLGPDVKIRGRIGAIRKGSAGTLINRGSIVADSGPGNIFISGDSFENLGRMLVTNGGTITLQPAKWTNSAPIEASGNGTLAFGGDWKNVSTLKLNGGNLRLGGTFTPADLGTIERTGGNVSVNGTYDLGGATQVLDASTGSWTLEGGTIKNGTIEQTGGARMRFSISTGNTFDAVKVVGDLRLTTAQDYLRILNGLTLEGTAFLDQFALLDFPGTQSWDNAEVVFGTSGTVQYGTQLTLGPNMKLHGRSGTIRQFNAGKLINQGMIAADVPGTPFLITGNNFENLGTLELRNGASLSILPATWNNTGLIDAAGGGTLTFGGDWNNAGQMKANGVSLKLGGAFSPPNLGNFERTGGTVAVTGTCDLVGGTLALNAVTGSWVLEAGTIKNGTITQSDGAALQYPPNVPNSTLDAVKLVGNMNLTAANAFLRIRNGLTLEGVVSASNGGTLEFAGAQTWNTGEFFFPGASGFLQINGQVTFGPAILIHGKSGLIRQFNSSARLANQGIIAADVTGARQFVNVDHLQNSGTIRASVADSILTINSADFTNTGTIEQLNGGKLLVNP